MQQLWDRVPQEMHQTHAGEELVYGQVVDGNFVRRPECRQINHRRWHVRLDQSRRILAACQRLRAAGEEIIQFRPPSRPSIPH